MACGIRIVGRLRCSQSRNFKEAKDSIGHLPIFAVSCLKPTPKSGAPNAVWAPVNEKSGGLPSRPRPRCQSRSCHAEADAKAPASIVPVSLGRKELGRGNW